MRPSIALNGQRTPTLKFQSQTSSTSPSNEKAEGQNSLQPDTELESKEVPESTTLKNTESRLRITLTKTRQTILVKRTRNSEQGRSLLRKECTHLSSPQCSPDEVERRFWLVPQDRPLKPFVLRSMIFRMFGKSGDSFASNSADSVSRSSNTNSMSSSIPPRFTSGQGAKTAISSPNFQIIRKFPQIRQLQTRSFSRSCIQRTGEGGIPQNSAGANSPPQKCSKHGRPTVRRIRLARHLKLQSGKRMSDPLLTSLSSSMKQFPKGPSIASASHLTFSQSLRYVKLPLGLNLDAIEERPSTNDMNHVASKSPNTAELINRLEVIASKSMDDAEQQATSRSPAQQSQNRPGPIAMSFFRHLQSIFGNSSSGSSLYKDGIAGSAASVSATSMADSRNVKADDVIVTNPVSSTFPIRTTGLLPQLPSETPVLIDVASMEKQPLISRLAHGLDRVLFNQSVHWLQDPHSEVFNFPPDLQALPSVTDFAFERLPKYKSSSEDDRLLHLAIQHSKPFVGSTSTLTKILSHIYFLLSDDRPVDTSTLSMAYVDQSRKFTPGMRMPASFSLYPRLLPSCSPQVYAVDSSRSEFAERQTEWNVLLWLGTMMEKFLTHPKEQFDSLRRENPPIFSFTDKPEAYRFAKSSKFIMRSQLDCQDSRLPGTGIFDLKSRAVLPIRIDQLNIQQHSGYLIRQTTGLYESFEREYYDLIRSAFLKYNFQARIGNMDGIFVAYHNTARLFGFQYVPVTEMEARLYGPGHPDRGYRIFEKCVGLMEAIMERITRCFPGYVSSCTIETREDTNQLHVWVIPIHYPAYPAPIEEFVVTVRHTVNDVPVDGKVAIERAYQNWTVQYHITRVLDSPEQTWNSLRKCQRRAEFAVVLPEGVSMDQARAHLNSVNWGTGLGFRWDSKDEVPVTVPGKELASEAGLTGDVPLSPKLTTRTYGLVTKLRRMAKRGKASLEEEEKKPQVMWGRDPDVVDDGLPTQNHKNIRNVIDLNATSQPLSPGSQAMKDSDKPA